MSEFEFYHIIITHIAQRLSAHNPLCLSEKIIKYSNKSQCYRQFGQNPPLNVRNQTINLPERPSLITWDDLDKIVKKVTQKRSNLATYDSLS